MKAKYNDIRLGVVLGLLAPVLGLLVIYLAAFRNMALMEYLEFLSESKKLSSIISLSAIPNLLLFFIFIWLNYLYSARGVLASTLLYALVVIVTKYLI
jgi:uncharacterized BrkB/YihY/UPF0761 family membrane protein